LSRLISKRRQDFAPASPTTYKRRFLQALREFLAYTKNPTMTWNKSSKSPATKNKSHQRPTTKEKLAAGAVRSADGNSGDVAVPPPEPVAGVT